MEIAYLLAIRLSALEDEQEHSINHVHDLVVAVLENHLEIEADKLGQVLVGVGSSVLTTRSISAAMAI